MVTEKDPFIGRAAGGEPSFWGKILANCRQACAVWYDESHTVMLIEAWRTFGLPPAPLFGRYTPATAS